MQKLSSDSLFYILNQYSLKGNDGYFNEIDHLSPGEAFLQYNGLISIRESHPDYPELYRYVITDKGKEQLGKYRARHNRHCVLIAAFSVLSGFLFFSLMHKVSLTFPSVSSFFEYFALLFPICGAFAFLDNLSDSKQRSQFKFSLVAVSAIFGFPALSLLLSCLLI